MHGAIGFLDPFLLVITSEINVAVSHTITTVHRVKLLLLKWLLSGRTVKYSFIGEENKACFIHQPPLVCIYCHQKLNSGK